MQTPAGHHITEGGAYVKNSYLGIPVTRENCYVMEYVCIRSFDTMRVPTRRDMNRWDRFKITVGQLARFSIATNQAAKDRLYLPGYFFEVAAKPLVFKLYISHFSMFRTDATATNRSYHFRLICEAAMELYREYDKHPNDVR